MQFLKKHWSNLLMLLFLALLFIPQTAMPIKVFVNSVFAFSPSQLDVDEQTHLADLSWNLVDLEGNRVDLADSEGRVILINQWATWCPPCVAEMPSLQALFADYGGEVDFYFVSQEPAETLVNFLIKKELNIPVFMPAEAPPAGIEGRALPTTYLIDKEGKIVIREEGAARWDSEKVRALVDTLL